MPVAIREVKRECLSTITQQNPSQENNLSEMSVSLHKNKIKLELVYLFAEVTFWNPSEINPQSSFMEMGLTSLNGADFIDKINKEFSLALKPMVLFDYSSLETLSQYIESLKVTSFSRESKRKTGRNLTQKILKEFPELIPLSIREKGIPCFWIHPLTGAVGAYRKIVNQLPPSYSYFGIQSKGLFTNKEPLLTIEEIASYYIQCIEALSFEGPYHLAGYSMGGVIAYEISRQLREKNKTIQTLILLEPPYNSNNFDLLKNVHRSDSELFKHAMFMSTIFLLHSSIEDEEMKRSFFHYPFSKIENELKKISDEKLIIKRMLNLCLEHKIHQPLKLIQKKLTQMTKIYLANQFPKRFLIMILFME